MSYLFKHIPNDEDGNLFIEQLRNYINRDLVKGVRARGRGSRVKWEKIDQMNYQSHIPQNRAERLHLYFDYNEDNESLENVDHARQISKQLDETIESLKFLSQHQYLSSMIEEEINDLEKLIELDDKYGDENWFHYSAWWNIKQKKNQLKSLLELLDDGGE
jgi:hypothetical protein